MKFSINSLSLVLFDIDGTLIYSKGIGKFALRDTIIEYYDKKNILLPEMSGKTDDYIWKEIIRLNSLDYQFFINNKKKILNSYVKRLKQYALKTEFSLLPGVKKLIERLSNEKIELGIVSGNIEKAGFIKIAKFNLIEYFKFNSFSRNGMTRGQLLKSAIYQFLFEKNISDNYIKNTNIFKRIFFIGDSYQDYLATKENSVRSILTATGIEKFSKLSALEHDILLHNLSDTEKIINIIKDNFYEP